VLGVGPHEALFVGDRPDKDVAGAAAAGMRSIRVLTGEYAGLPDTVAPLVRVADVAAAIAHIEALFGPRRTSPPACPAPVPSRHDPNVVIGHSGLT
jgi:hypothetical protein